MSDSITLRRRNSKLNVLLDPSPWPPTEQNDPPRALRVLGKIVDGGLCHRCGSCVGICPTSVLGLDDEDYPEVKNLASCTDCDLCTRVCPGESFMASEFLKELYPEVPDNKDMHGYFDEAWLASASDQSVREASTSGGLVTALLMHLLESKVIDGAIVIESDPDTLWKGKPTIARTPAEVLKATKSKYAISPTNAVFAEIRQTPGKYALVGLPCQIHGYHKAAKLDKRLKERIVLTIGLFCHAAVEHEPMRIIWEMVEKNHGPIKRFISRVGKHPGTPHVELQDGSLTPVYFPKAKGYRPSSMEILNIMYRLYTPSRCLTCYDSTAEFADIAVGDPWMPKPADDISFTDGYSFALARTKRGVDMLHLAHREGAVDLVRLEKATARGSNTMMGEEKRWRAFRIIETHRRQGKPIPDYGFCIPSPSGLQFVLTELNILSHILCFIKRGRTLALRLALSPIGYALLWSNNQRRKLRQWRKERRAKKARQRQFAKC